MSVCVCACMCAYTAVTVGLPVSDSSGRTVTTLRVSTDHSCTV